MNDLSKRVDLWKKEKARKNLRLTQKQHRQEMNVKYHNLTVRYGAREDGLWSNEISGCDLKQASILLSQPMAELYESLEQSKGWVRTMSYEVQVS